MGGNGGVSMGLADKKLWIDSVMGRRGDNRLGAARGKTTGITEG